MEPQNPYHTLLSSTEVLTPGFAFSERVTSIGFAQGTAAVSASGALASQASIILATSDPNSSGVLTARTTLLTVENLLIGGDYFTAGGSMSASSLGVSFLDLTLSINVMGGVAAFSIDPRFDQGIASAGFGWQLGGAFGGGRQIRDNRGLNDGSIESQTATIRVRPGDSLPLTLSMELFTQASVAGFANSGFSSSATTVTADLALEWGGITAFQAFDADGNLIQLEAGGSFSILGDSGNEFWGAPPVAPSTVPEAASYIYTLMLAGLVFWRAKCRISFGAVALFAILMETIVPIRAAIIYSNDFETNTIGFNITDTNPGTPTGSTGATSTFLGTIGTNGAILTLSGLTAGAVYDLAFDLYLGGTWDGSVAFGPDYFSLSSSSSGFLVNATFRNGYPVGNPTPTQTYSDATPLGGSVLFPDRQGADVIDPSTHTIYYFGHGAGNPLLSFTATGANEQLTFHSQDQQIFQADEYFLLDNVVVTGPASNSVPETAPSIALLILSLTAISLFGANHVRRAIFRSS